MRYRPCAIAAKVRQDQRLDQHRRLQGTRLADQRRHTRAKFIRFESGSCSMRIDSDQGSSRRRCGMAHVWDARATLHVHVSAPHRQMPPAAISRCTGDGTRSFDALPRSHSFRLYRPSVTSRNRSNIHVYDVCPSRSRSMSMCHVPCPESCRP